MYFAIIRVDSACQIRLFSRLQGQSIGTEDHGLYGEFGRFLGVLPFGFKVGGAGHHGQNGKYKGEETLHDYFGFGLLTIAWSEWNQSFHI